MYKDANNVWQPLLSLSQGELVVPADQPADGRIVRFQLTAADKKILAKSPKPLYVTVEADGIKDTNDNLNSAQETLAIASNDLPPQLIVVNYNHDRLELFVKFDEEIQVYYDPDTNADNRGDIPGNDENRPRSELVTITDGAKTVVLSAGERQGGQAAETNSFTFILTDANRDEVSSWGKSVPADILVMLGGGAFRDLADNPNVAAAGIPLSAYTFDTTPPVVTAVHYIPVGPNPDAPIRQLIITLSEPMESATGTGTAILGKMFVLGTPGAAEIPLTAGAIEYSGNKVKINGVTTYDDADRYSS
jgi:hypothetical protein